MDVLPPSLEIRIHLANGRTDEFVQTNPAAIRVILEGIQPGKLFSQEHLLIAGKYSMTAYSCSAVTAVELIMEGWPDWPLPMGIQDIRQVSEEDFWKQFEAEKDERFIREQPRTVGEPFVGFLEITVE